MTYVWLHPWFGLTAGTGEGLRPFAEDLGRYRQFCRPRMAGSEVLSLVGHYDLDEEEHDGALAKGAVPQT